MRKSIACLMVTLVISVIFLCPTAFADEMEPPMPEYTEEDIILLARLISAEAGGEEFEGQLAVGNVVTNRLESGIWGDTLSSVIYAEGQFAQPHKAYTESCYEAAKEALLGDDRAVPEYILYFQRGKVEWFYGPWYTAIGAHNFYGAPYS